ncbi:HD-GYP domain-containing protein [sulfur-oxidizing endosymbiont of Gigantopelta aegis]|uniref:HD-GYP domain-containing protein n=1 Tax=sulfur-oxidizing endosymbiont of Gigantopelta aegis TaxID=2794934 RepID=UPI001BE4CD8D|nr:HD domain-containing phosphohydrolase [sulfur-oxidizing endosymbiont of Gigantopelta aegis]
MSSTLKKISINELLVGMFIVKMDVSWIKSPFLLHRRAIKSKNDIILLKKSGVKLLTIDLDKSQIDSEHDVGENTASENDSTKKSSPDTQFQENDAEEPKVTPLEFSADDIDKSSLALSEELNNAVVLKEQANKAFNEINNLVKDNQPVSIKQLEPVIDDTISSLLRNSQALLTLMHLKRSDAKLFSHSFSVMSLALTFAIKDGVTGDDLKTLGLAALLHDIGWAQLPLNLFGKAKKYSENENKVVLQHLKIADIIISKSDGIPYAVKQLMSKHHERIDGSGYPNALKGEQLDNLAKILIMTDYYDELVHGLLDQPGLIPSEALRLLYKETVQNTQDKEHVELLIKLLGIYPLTSAIELTSGEKGLVVEVNREKPLVPVVKIIYSKSGHVLPTALKVDLEKDPLKRQIKTIVDLSNKTADPNNLLLVEEV